MDFEGCFSTREKAKVAQEKLEEKRRKGQRCYDGIGITEVYVDEEFKNG